MAVINRFGIKQPDDSYIYHEVGAKATNVLMSDNTTVEESMEDLIEKLKDKLDTTGGKVTGALTLAGGAPYIGYNKYVAFPQGGQFTSNETIIGTLKVILPVYWDNTLIKFKISIANYKENSSVDYVVSGYMSTSTSSWEQCTAVAIGPTGGTLSNLPVSFGYNTNMRCVVMIGDNTTSWSFASVTISDVTIHKPYNSINLVKWSENWEIRLNVNNDTTIQKTIDNPSMVAAFVGGTQENIDAALTEAKQYTDDKIEGIFEDLPEALDTLKEITAEITDNQSAIDTIVSAMNDKLNTTTFNEHAENTEIHVTAAEKERWDGKQDTITVDDALSTESMNAVQNRIITAELNKKLNAEEGKVLSSNDFTDAYKNKIDNMSEDANKYVHPESGVFPGTYRKVTVDSMGHVTEGSNDVLTIAEGGTGADTPQGILQNLGINATPAELNILSGVEISTGHLNYLNGATGNIQTQIDNKAGKDLATTEASGLMSAADKKKLQGIAAGANLYYHPEYESAGDLGLYKIGIDTLGHVFNKQAITKTDITELGIPASDTNTTYTLTKSGSTITLTGSDGSTTSVADADNNTTYSQATSSALGLVKIGYSATGKNYAVQLNSSGQMYVNVPWTDNNTTYSAGTGISLSGTTFSNSGVRSIATGTANGTISVNTNGTAANVAVKGLAAGAYTATYAGSSSAGGAATSALLLGADATMTLVAERSNEVNFGGTNTSSTIFFGYRAAGSKPIPTKFVFGNSTGTAEVVAAKFTGALNGTATNASTVGGYSVATAATASTVALRTSGGYLNATYFNQSSGAETPTTSSYIIYCNSDGYFRKSSIANAQSILGITELKNSVSDGKKKVANAITAKGVTTATDATFDTMATNIGKISGGITYPTAISTFSASGYDKSLTVNFSWALPTDSARSGVVIRYSTSSAPTSATAGTALYDSNTYTGTTATSCSFTFSALGTYYVSIFTYTYVNNVRHYSAAKSINFKISLVQGVKKFTSSGTFTVPTGVSYVDVFLVGGGYQGAYASDSSYGPYQYRYYGGNGGRGGYYYTVKKIAVTPGGTVSVTIGAANGGASRFGSYSSSSGTAGAAGGSGACVENNPGGYTPIKKASAGTSGVYAFGDSTWSASYDSSIRYCAGGGGGGSMAATGYTTGGAGGTTGGGKGGNYGSVGTAGTANTGSGGGGGGYYQNGGNGGTGCVLIRYGFS